MNIKVAPACACMAALAAFGGSGTAAAAEMGFYVGGYYAEVSADIERTGFDEINLDLYDFYGITPGPIASTFETDDTGYGFLVGYRLWRNLAFEAGYMELGEVSYEATTEGTFAGGSATFDTAFRAKTGGIAVSALGILPLSYRWEVYGRVGLLFATNELDFFITDRVASDGGRFSDSGVEYFVGAGLGVTFAEIYTARLEYQRVMDTGSDETGTGDIDVTSLGVVVRF